jgi:hypothetical protein
MQVRILHQQPHFYGDAKLISVRRDDRQIRQRLRPPVSPKLESDRDVDGVVPT